MSEPPDNRENQPQDPYSGTNPYAKQPPPAQPGPQGLPQYPGPQSSPYGGGQQSPYGGPQPMAGPPGPPMQPHNDSKTLSVIAIVLGCISLFFCPPLFGGAALVCAIIAKVQNRPLSTPALVVAIVGLVGGIGIGILLWSAGFTYGS
ncbi:hypothetical protein [Streptomyces boninensis]|uniref:hypothetical protein n=1 Tax=Streptomyces boninensis TaxID=2039455 RepID=UPI003B21F5A4